MTNSDDHKQDPPNLVRLETSQATEEDPCEDLREALTVLESKLQSAEGPTDLAQWLREVETAVAALPGRQVSHTCDEIKELIHHLLSLNAQVQNLMRLKQLLA